MGDSGQAKYADSRSLPLISRVIDCSLVSYTITVKYVEMMTLMILRFPFTDRSVFKRAGNIFFSESLEKYIFLPLTKSRISFSSS